MITVPFTKDQCDKLNQYQNSGHFHPFTCGKDECRSVLIATMNGWKCPSCDYTQNWAHDFMATKLSNPLVDNLEGDTDEVDEEE